MNTANTLGTHVFSDGLEGGPRLITQGGKSIYYHRCFNCGRDFGLGLNGGSWRAIYVGMFRIDLLADSVNDQWLSQPCPGQPQWGQDAAARTMRHTVSNSNEDTAA